MAAETLSTDAFNVSLLWHHRSEPDVEPEMADDFLPAFSHIGDDDYVDLSGAWRATDNVRVMLTVRNLLDKELPIIGNTTTAVNSGNTFPQEYGVVGRYFTLVATASY